MKTFYRMKDGEFVAFQGEPVRRIVYTHDEGADPDDTYGFMMTDGHFADREMVATLQLQHCINSAGCGEDDETERDFWEGDDWESVFE